MASTQSIAAHKKALIHLLALTFVRRTTKWSKTNFQDRAKSAEVQTDHLPLKINFEQSVSNCWPAWKLSSLCSSIGIGISTLALVGSSTARSFQFAQLHHTRNGHTNTWKKNTQHPHVCSDCVAQEKKVLESREEYWVNAKAKKNRANVVNLDATASPSEMNKRFKAIACLRYKMNRNLGRQSSKIPLFHRIRASTKQFLFISC